MRDRDTDAEALEALLVDEDFRAHADFRYALRRFVRLSEQHARAVGLTPQQHQLLLAVRGHPAYPQVSISDIAERLQLRHHSASLLVERSVKRGLLQRVGDPADHRRVLVSLTEEGARALAHITVANRDAIQPLEEALLHVRTLIRLRALVRQARGTPDVLVR